MISFRLSEDEYTGLKNLCVNEGARSVSDMARDAVHRMINNHSFGHNTLVPNSQVESIVQLLQRRIEMLDREVKRLGMALDQHSAATGARVRNSNAEL
jgi:hypothetical protein